MLQEKRDAYIRMAIDMAPQTAMTIKQKFRDDHADLLRVWADAETAARPQGATHEEQLLLARRAKIRGRVGGG